MNKIKQVCDELQEWAASNGEVRALLWYGSVARDDFGIGSDVDAAVLIAAESGPSRILESLLGWFGSRVVWSVATQTSSSATIWLDRSLTKIDLLLAQDPEELCWLSDSPDIAPPRLRVSVDKEGVCGSIVARAGHVIPRDVSRLVHEEVEKFTVAFEACSRAHARSDGYQFYFHYNLALQRAARLIELARGEPVYLFLPKFLLPRRMSEDQQKKWRELRGTLYLPEASSAKRRLLDAFVEVVDELHRQGRTDRPSDEIRPFLEAVMQRDYFFNLRDFADAFEGRVKPGVLFRSSTLTRWQRDPALHAWLAREHVRCIVDFRHPDEIRDREGAYSPEVLNGILYVTAPLSLAPKRGTIPLPTQAGYAYQRTFESHRSNLLRALRTVFDSGDGSTLVHCHAGKDRTGWFCATIALLLELPREQIEQDYLASGSGVAVEAIQHFLDWVDSQGGAFTLLEPVGLTEHDVRQLRDRLLHEAAAG